MLALLQGLGSVISPAEWDRSVAECLDSKLREVLRAFQISDWVAQYNGWSAQINVWIIRINSGIVQINDWIAQINSVITQINS